jgi:DNA-binding LacI/PurR family transcriptional regulator
MIIPDGSNQFFSRLAQLVQRELTQAANGLVLFDSDGSPNIERDYIRWIAKQWQEGAISALIYIPSGDNLDNFEDVFALDLPIVVIDREIPEDFASRPIDQVLADNNFGMKLVVEHLVEIGISTVAYISGPVTTEPGRVRNHSFERYWNQMAGGTLAASFVGDFAFESGREAAEAVLRLAAVPEAVVAANDLMALGAMQALQRSGRRVPDDVVVVGYDDIPLASWVFPTLTTVRQDVEEMAKQAAIHVMRRMGGEGGRGGFRTPIEPELVRRDSSRR